MGVGQRGSSKVAMNNERAEVTSKVGATPGLTSCAIGFAGALAAHVYR